MKAFKMSALVVAILAIGATFAFNANAIGKRVVTACYQAISLQNASGALTFSPASSTTKVDVETAVISNGIQYLQAAPSTTSGGGLLNSTYFHCAKFDVVPAPVTGVPFITIGGVNAQWEVNELRYDAIP